MSAGSCDFNARNLRVTKFEGPLQHDKDSPSPTQHDSYKSDMEILEIETRTRLTCTKSTASIKATIAMKTTCSEPGLLLVCVFVYAGNLDL